MAEKKEYDKNQVRRGLFTLIVFIAVVVLLVMTVVHALSNHSKPASNHTAQTAPKTTTKQTTKPSNASQPPQPKPSLASVNTQAASILTSGAEHFETIFNNGQSVMNGSGWPTYYANLMKTDDKQAVSSYNYASNLYSKYKYTAPDAVGNWYNDINTVQSDIDAWAGVVTSYRGGTASLDQVNSAEQAYQKELAVTQDDVKQL